MPTDRPAAGSGYQLDTSNPLAADLQLAILYAADGDVVGDGPAVTAMHDHNSGEGFRCTIDQMGTDPTMSWLFTVVQNDWQFRRTYPLMFNSHPDDGDVLGYRWHDSSSQRRLQTRRANGTAFTNYAPATPWSAVATYSSAQGRFYDASGTLLHQHNSNLFNLNGNTTIGTEDADHVGNFAVNTLYMWRRQLSSSEAAQVLSDPYALFASSFNPALAVATGTIVPTGGA